MKTIRFNYLNTLHKEIGYEKSQLIKKIKNYIAECLEGRDNFEIPEWLRTAYKNKHYGNYVFIESMDYTNLEYVVSARIRDDLVIVDTADDEGNGRVYYTISPCDVFSLLAVSEFVNTYISNGIDHQLNELYDCIDADVADIHDVMEMFCHKYDYDFDEIDLDDVLIWKYNYKPIEE